MAPSPQAKTKSTACKNAGSADNNKQHTFQISELSAEIEMDKTLEGVQYDKEAVISEGIARKSYAIIRWESEMESDVPWFHPGVLDNECNTRTAGPEKDEATETEAGQDIEVQIEMGIPKNLWDPKSTHKGIPRAFVGIGAVDLVGVGQQFVS